MDHYVFPSITHISQCIDAIKGSDEFVVAERDGHTIINYIMMESSTFPRVYAQDLEITYDVDAALRRECRGIVFGTDGRVIARRLHKFFNCGERPETELAGINFQKQHVILDKLDGSMITPIPIRDHVRWGTKMGLTSVGFQAEEFVSTRPEYNAFAQHCITNGQTPIFEWCSRKQRIVVDYPKDQLVLLTVRDNITGIYLTYEYMKALGEYWNIPVVGTLGLVTNPELFLSTTRVAEEIEGYVVRFQDGHCVKVKGDWYVRIHRAKDSIMQEKRVVEMIVNHKVDDVLPHLLKMDQKALEGFRDEFWRGLMETMREVTWLYSHWYKKTEGDKKRFAIEAEINPLYKSVMFSIWGALGVNQTDDLAFEELKRRVQKNLGSGTRVEASRWLWGSTKWADYIQAEDA